MDDAGTRHLGQFRRVVQQSIEQGAVLMAGSRMHDKAGRLVDHQQRVVFINDVQIDGFGLPLALNLALGIQLQPLTTQHNVTGALDLTIDQQTAVLDPALQAGTGIVGEQLRGHLVQALTTRFRADLCGQTNTI